MHRLTLDAEGTGRPKSIYPSHEPVSVAGGRTEPPSAAHPRGISVADTKKIFIGFAVEDKNYRDLLRGQSKLGDSPIDYTDMSVKEPWENSWKTNCRQRIAGCDGLIALLSQNVRDADGARWEISCAVAEGIPVLGVHIHQEDDYKPFEIAGQTVIRWTWDGIGNWIDGL